MKYVPSIAKVLQDDVNRIEQLCSMVNTYAKMLNLGHKVTAADWTEQTKAALAGVRVTQ